MKKLLLGLLLATTTISCSTPEQIQQEDCSKATIMEVNAPPILQPEKTYCLIKNNCTGVFHTVWFLTSTQPQVGQQTEWR